MGVLKNFLTNIPGTYGNYENFFEVAHPVYLVSRNFGFLPFTIKFNSKHKIEGLVVSYKDLLRFFIALAGYMISIIFSCRENFTLTHHSLIIVYGYRLIIIFGLLLAIFGVVMDMFNRKSVMFVLKEINEIDDEVTAIIFA